MLLSAVIMVGALITYMLFPALAVLSLSIGWAGLLALASSDLALLILQQVDKVQNSFNK